MQKWEYMFMDGDTEIYKGSNASRVSLQTALNNLGREGWEVVWNFPQTDWLRPTLMLLKRPVEQKRPFVSAPRVPREASSH
ncbi:MAG: hypothetical protein WD850_02805 [Candidatus Spechtbacterales bacterium]